jgi:hypothetical protein
VRRRRIARRQVQRTRRKEFRQQRSANSEGRIAQLEGQVASLLEQIVTLQLRMDEIGQASNVVTGTAGTQTTGDEETNQYSTATQTETVDSSEHAAQASEESASEESQFSPTRAQTTMVTWIEAQSNNEDETFDCQASTSKPTTALNAPEFRINGAHEKRPRSTPETTPETTPEKPPRSKKTPTPVLLKPTAAMIERAQRHWETRRRLEAKRLRTPVTTPPVSTPVSTPERPPMLSTPERPPPNKQLRLDALPFTPIWNISGWT